MSFEFIKSDEVWKEGKNPFKETDLKECPKCHKSSPSDLFVGNICERCYEWIQEENEARADLVRKELNIEEENEN